MPIRQSSYLPHDLETTFRVSMQSNFISKMFWLIKNNESQKKKKTKNLIFFLIKGIVTHFLLHFGVPPVCVCVYIYIYIIFESKNLLTFPLNYQESMTFYKRTSVNYDI